jgi:hypothetical protein
METGYKLILLTMVFAFSAASIFVLYLSGFPSPKRKDKRKDLIQALIYLMIAVWALSELLLNWGNPSFTMHWRGGGKI